MQAEGRVSQKRREEGRKAMNERVSSMQLVLTMGKGLIAGVMPAMLASAPDLEEDVACPMGLEMSDGAVEGAELEEDAMAASIPVETVLWSYRGGGLVGARTSNLATLKRERQDQRKKRVPLSSLASGNPLPQRAGGERVWGHRYTKVMNI